MYKLISVCVILCLCMPNILCMSDEMKELIDMLHNTCQGESGADEGLIQRAQKGDFDEDGKLKCYMKCIMSEMSTISDDGVVDVDATVALLPDDIRVKLEPHIRKCGSPAGSDACDVAWKAFKCLAAANPTDFFLP